MKVILYCSPQATEPLTQAIKAAGHIVVDALSNSQNLIHLIAQHTPQALVSDISHLVARPQALAIILNSYPSLSTFGSYMEKAGWEAKLREFLDRPRPPEKPRPYATSERTIYHDAELKKLASGKLRRPDFTAPDWQAACVRQEARFVLQLQTGGINHTPARHYYRCMKAQQRGLDQELAYRLVHGSYKALCWSRDLAARWLGLLCHYIPGVELDYLPPPMTPGPRVDYVHHNLSAEGLYVLTLIILFGVAPAIEEEIKFLGTAHFERQSDTDLLQLSLRLYGLAKFLQQVGTAQVRLMDQWLEPARVEVNQDTRTYKRCASTYRDFYDFRYIVRSPHPLDAILTGFHRGTTYVINPNRVPTFREFLPLWAEEGKTPPRASNP